MVHIVLFNTEYERQFEVVLSRKKWNSLVSEYGTVDAVVMAFITSTDIQFRGTTKRATNYRGFIRYTVQTGEFAVTIGEKRTTPVGQGEYVIGRRGARRSDKALARMNLPSKEGATRRASRKHYRTQKELKETYGKDYALKEAKKRAGSRW